MFSVVRNKKINQTLRGIPCSLTIVSNAAWTEISLSFVKSVNNHAIKITAFTQNPIIPSSFLPFVASFCDVFN